MCVCTAAALTYDKERFVRGLQQCIARTILADIRLSLFCNEWVTVYAARTVRPVVFDLVILKNP